jgi:hypothetical protein
MISQRFFALHPTSELQTIVRRLGDEADAVRPELLVREHTSRNRAPEAVDVALIKAIYVKVFLDDLFGSSQADWPELAEQIESLGFDALWSIEVFEDCEDIATLMANMDLQ